MKKKGGGWGRKKRGRPYYIDIWCAIAKKSTELLIVILFLNKEYKGSN
jgi:hypothetical protein